jgi:hypothetical protein
MAVTINSDTILIHEGGFSPTLPQRKREPYLKVRSFVPDSQNRGLNRRTREAGWSFFCAVGGPLYFWLFLLFFAALVTGVQAQTKRTIPTLETIIACMAQARDENEARFRSYVVTRDYKLFGKERDKSKSQVIADVIFVPPDLKSYAIQQTNGTKLGEIIVRRMLTSEAEITKDCISTDLSSANYEFRFIREEEMSGQRCYMLELFPRRKDRHLLRGHIWVDANTYLLRRTEGEPAKIPSWWLQDVRMSFLYGDVGGMWLQTAMEATATVRILGPYTMVSRDVKYKLGEPVVAARLNQALQAHAGRISSAPRDSPASK